VTIAGLFILLGLLVAAFGLGLYLLTHPPDDDEL